MMGGGPAYVLGDDLDRVAAARGEAPAVTHGDRSVSYRELSLLADRIAAALCVGGTGRGDRVVVLSRSAVDVLAVVVGASRIGAVTVPANWRLSAAEVDLVLADSGSTVAIVDRDLAAGLGRHDGVRVVVLEEWDTWLAGARSAPDRFRPGEHDPALQIYTSGTSGRPKGVVLTHGNLAQKVTRMSGSWGFGDASTSLLATPLFHIGGLSWALVGLTAGAHLVVPSRVDPDSLLTTLETHRVTHAFLVPKLLTDLVRVMVERGLRGSPLELVLCGAAPVGAVLQEQAGRTLECRIVQVYGLTETTGAITELDVTEALHSPQPDAVLRTCGRPYPWVEIEIRDPDDQRPLAQGVAGEVWTRSAQNCQGYWNRSAETAELLVDGWLRTGDGGYLDDEGRLQLTDRIKDMIVSGGENIYSIEVERVLRTHPAVRDVAVVGRPDQDWGEVVVAVVELNPGHQLDLTTAADVAGAALGRYKRPRDLLVVAELPRNHNGKVLKREVRELVSASTKEVHD